MIAIETDGPRAQFFSPGILQFPAAALAGHRDGLRASESAGDGARRLRGRQDIVYPARIRGDRRKRVGGGLDCRLRGADHVV